MYITELSLRSKFKKERWLTKTPLDTFTWSCKDGGQEYRWTHLAFFSKKKL
jgi:hypothetical protein